MDVPPILSTKLYVPPPRSDCISRSELLQKLDSARNRKLTLVSAQAGYGKTTLLADWAEQIGSPCAWLSLDKSDNDPMRLLGGIVAAIRTQEHDWASGLDEWLAGTHSLQPAALVSPLIHEIVGTSLEAVLILDDCHALYQTDALAFLEAFIEALPPGMHLVLSSRTDPLIPIARLRVLGELMEIRDHDLKFEIDEIDRYMRRAMDLELSDDELTILEKQTEGWPAGVQMAGLSLRSAEDPSARLLEFSANHRFVVDFLAEEVLSQQPSDLRSFLMKTSVLNRFSAPLAESVTGQKDAEQMIREVERRNLFLVPLDQSRTWFRYHHLFARLLQDILIRAQPAEARQVHELASVWHEREGWPEEAIHHALRSEAMDRAESLIEAGADDMWTSSRLKTLLYWLEQLPEARLRENPRLCLYQVWTLFLLGRLPGAEDRLCDLEPTWLDSVHEREQKELLGMRAAIQSSLARTRGEYGAALALAKDALDRIPAKKLDWRIVSTVNLGLAHNLLGQPRGAKEAFRESWQLSRQVGNDYASVVSASGLAQANILQGQLRQAADKCQQVLTEGIPHEASKLTVSARVELRLATVQLEWNQLELAEQTLASALERGEQEGNPRILGEGRILLGRLRLAQGKPDEAADLLQQAHQAMIQADVPDVLPWAEIYLARSWLEQGSLDKCSQWASEAAAKISGPIDLRSEAALLTIAHLDLILGRSPLESLMDLEFAAREHGRVGSLIEILILKALGQAAAGEMELADDALAEAVDLGSQGGYHRVFLEYGPELLPHLTRLIWRQLGESRSDAISEYLQSKLEHMQEEPGFQPLLTPREVEVLALVADGQTNREIAEVLYVEVGTIKTHLHRIYTKLEVKNRAEAAFRARQLGAF